MSKKSSTLTAEQIDKKFDDGEDVLEYFDLENPQVVAPIKQLKKEIEHKETIHKREGVSGA
ncbi:hypothetical protein [Varibaculum massiliense]|uniref:hypothetical protein n=1 Tax=Varibaculum massiliense TaxID=1852372 RepID=UPI002889D7B3|nr:hypothetical protein [Varibaculum massiliense]